MRILWILVFVSLGLLLYNRHYLAWLWSAYQYQNSHNIKPPLFTNESGKSITPAWYSQKIPFKIHQTSSSKEVDYQINSSANINHYANLEYDYYFYDESARVDYIRQHYPEYLRHYNAMVPGEYKVDLFRLLVLYREGGVYMDDKTFTLKPLREILRPEDELYLIKDNVPGCIFQGALFSIPGHPLMKKFIDRYISNIEKRHYGIDTYDIGGPRMIGRVLNSHYGKDELAPIESFTDQGLRIEGETAMLSGLDEVILSDDKKTLYFERASRSYIIRKAKQILSGKDYNTLWVLRKVYH